MQPGALTLTCIPERPRGVEWLCVELLMECHVKGTAGVHEGNGDDDTVRAASTKVQVMTCLCIG